jgi:hypothetical protein
MSLVYPMFVMVLLTFATVVALFVARSRFVQQRRVDPAFFSTYQDGQEPATSAKLARHFSNLLEAPTLFYVGCVAAMASGHETPLFVGLAWAYVVARLVHSAIHVGPNVLIARVSAYFTSWALLVAFWIALVAAVAGDA